MLGVAGATGLLLVAPSPSAGQAPVEGEVRQIVTFSFLPGRSAEAQDVFRELALPLYGGDEDMITFRAFREVESPTPLDLVVVSAFEGMAGMDRSNDALRASGIGRFYAAIGPLIERHHDQFVEMLPDLGSGDPTSSHRTVFVWYRLSPGSEASFEAAVATVVDWERRSGIPSATGRFLVSDGWSYLRILGVESLGAYQAYWASLEGLAEYGRIGEVTSARREVILAAVPQLAVR